MNDDEILNRIKNPENGKLDGPGEISTLVRLVLLGGIFATAFSSTR